MNKERIKRITKHTLHYIAGFFQYAVVIYLLVFILSRFSDIWMISWHQPVLHIAVVIFGVIYLFDKRVELGPIGIQEKLRILPRNILDSAIVLTRYLVTKLKNGGLVKFSASCAIFFLALCPFLLWLKKDAIAEQSAIYAYYFLVISVILMIIENWLDKTP